MEPLRGGLQAVSDGVLPEPSRIAAEVQSAVFDQHRNPEQGEKGTPLWDIRCPTFLITDLYVHTIQPADYLEININILVQDEEIVNKHI